MTIQRLELTPTEKEAIALGGGDPEKATGDDQISGRTHRDGQISTVPADQKLVWIDIETTGLDPAKDLILEIACVITDFQLREMRSVVYQIKPSEGIPAMHPIVAKMHMGNGLLAALNDGAPLTYVDQALASLVGEYKGPICGASPHFDKSFIDQCMPFLKACFNHRCFDVSTLKKAANMWGMTTEKIEPDHRALADILGTIAECRKVREWATEGAEKRAYRRLDRLPEHES